MLSLYNKLVLKVFCCKLKPLRSTKKKINDEFIIQYNITYLVFAEMKIFVYIKNLCTFR